MIRSSTFYFGLALFLTGVLFSPAPYWHYSFHNSPDTYVLNISSSIGYGASLISIFFILHLIFVALSSLSIIIQFLLLKFPYWQLLLIKLSIGFLILSVLFGITSSMLFSQKLSAGQIISNPDIGFYCNIIPIILTALGLKFTNQSTNLSLHE